MAALGAGAQFRDGALIRAMRILRGDEPLKLVRIVHATPPASTVAGERLFVPGRLAASAAVLGQVVTVIEDFLDTVVWA